MPRDPKSSLVAIPHHIVQRSNDERPCFFAREDYVFFLKCLKEAARGHGCRIHAYVLLPDHLHLLGTPRTRNGFMGMMQTVRDTYAAYVKRAYGNAPGLFAGRYQASVVQPNGTLLDCYRYIELHPVRSGLAQHPAAYHWSSHAYHALGMADDLVTDHVVYRELGEKPNDRYQTYRELLRQPLDSRIVEAIRKATGIEGVLGDASFARQISGRLRRRPLPPRQPPGALSNESTDESRSATRATSQGGGRD